MTVDLLEAAREVAGHAHAPYSEYPVGAALRDEQGRVWAGCNVENVSYGLTMCAERSAVFAMVAGGGKRVREILILTVDAGPPCGACLQVLSEFGNGDLAIHLATSEGVRQTCSLKDLMPHAFRSDAIKSNAT